MTETKIMKHTISNGQELDEMTKCFDDNAITDTSDINELADTSSEHTSSDDAHVYVKGAARKLWLLNNKEKLAIYARSCYHKRVEKEPEYRKVLVQRTMERRHRLKAEKEPVPEKPKKEPVPSHEKKPGGRPRKYL